MNTDNLIPTHTANQSLSGIDHRTIARSGLSFLPTAHSIVFNSCLKKKKRVVFFFFSCDHYLCVFTVYKLNPLSSAEYTGATMVITINVLVRLISGCSVYFKPLSGKEPYIGNFINIDYLFIIV